MLFSILLALRKMFKYSISIIQGHNLKIFGFFWKEKEYILQRDFALAVVHLKVILKNWFFENIFFFFHLNGWVSFYEKHWFSTKRFYSDFSRKRKEIVVRKYFALAMFFKDSSEEFVFH